jgi:hypothetical protein
VREEKEFKEEADPREGRSLYKMHSTEEKLKIKRRIQGRSKQP